jgi:subtilisin family serine protease
VIHKLSPELRLRLRARRADEAAPAERTELLLEFNGDIADLIAVGFRPRSVLRHPVLGHTIATGTLPVDRLTDLAAIEHVVEVEGPKKLWPLLNYSVPAIHADAVQTGTPSRTGRNVVIGVVDSGIDWRHGDFFDRVANQSRILEIWDQTLPAESGETPGPTDIDGEHVGVIYSRDEITDAYKKNDEKKIRTRDNNGHGTHVAGIAAGNGDPACLCRTRNVYVGVAPDALLLVVKFLVDDPDIAENIHVVDAIDHIFNHPEVQGATPAQRRPAVINLSFGTNMGAHDGTALVERAIDMAVAAPGRAVVVGGGNEADELQHATDSVPARTADGPGERRIDFSIPEGCDIRQAVDIWYDRASTLNIIVASPAGVTKGPVDQGSGTDFVQNPGPVSEKHSLVSVVSTIDGPQGRGNNWRIQIFLPKHGNVPDGPWIIRLLNPGDTAVPFHTWIERAPGHHPGRFFDPADAPPGAIAADPNSTVTVPGTAAGAITVACHLNEPGCCQCNPGDGIDPSSSRGPVVRVAATNKKPDIAAPGYEITSALADARNFPGHCCSCCPNTCCVLYEDHSGTSMSAPHVTGTIALMFEENPNLTRDDILKYLRASATPPPPGEPPEWWGAGKLNALKAVEAVRAAGGGGGGGGGGGPHLTLDPDPDDSFSSRHRLLPAFAALRVRLLAEPEGVAIAAAVSRHFSEVRRLVNTNRRVATLWHRAAGPCLLRELLGGGIHPGGAAALLEGRRLDYLERWWDLLARYGSPRLKTSLARHRSTVMDLVCDRLPAWLESNPAAPPAPAARTEAFVGA